jgi:hypothetical protein
MSMVVLMHNSIPYRHNYVKPFSGAQSRAPRGLAPFSRQGLAHFPRRLRKMCLSLSGRKTVPVPLTAPRSAARTCAPSCSFRHRCRQMTTGTPPAVSARVIVHQFPPPLPLSVTDD